MLKLLTLTACFVAVSATPIDQYIGTIYPVYAFPASGAPQHCWEDMSLALHTGNIECKCNDVVLPVLELHTPRAVMYASFLITEKSSDLDAAVNQKCHCVDPDLKGAFGPVVVLPVNSEFFVLNTKEEVNITSIMLAKQKPTPAALESLVKSLEITKNKPGEVLCTTETGPTDETNKGTGSDLKKLFQVNKE